MTDTQTSQAMRRRNLVILSVLVAAGSWLSISSIQYHRHYSWQARLAIYRLSDTFTAHPDTPQEMTADNRYMFNNLLQRPMWSTLERDELFDRFAVHTDFGALAQIGSSASESPRYTKVQFLNRMAHDATQAVIGVRLQAGAPIDPAVRDAIVTMLVDQLANPAPSVRLGATSLVVQAGLADSDGPVRQKIVAMANDPDPTVAKNARNQLEWRDKDRRRAGR